MADFGCFAVLLLLTVLALALGERAAAFGLAFQALAVNRVLLEDGNGLGHRTDLVAALLAGNGDRKVAGSELLHRGGHVGHRADHEAVQQPGHGGDHQTDGKDRGNGCGNAELVQRREGRAAVDDETEIPFDRRQTGDGHEADEDVLAGKLRSGPALPLIAGV